MIKEINNNPFRILGLPANATREETDLCYHDLIEGLKQQGQSDDAMEEIVNAYQEIISPDRHWYHASFWFVCISDKDRHALQYVEEGQYEAAINIWEENLNYAASHNLILCYVLMGESAITFYGKAFYYARYFYLTENFDLFVECVNSSNKVAAEEVKVFLDAVFSQTTAEKSTLYALLGNKEWMEYVRGKWVEAEEADAGVENMKTYITIAEHAKKTEEAEKSRESFFKWLWWLLFPLALYFYHDCKNTQKPEPFMETYKVRHDSLKRVREIMMDSAHINREMRKMRERREVEHKSLKERINERRERLKEEQE